VKIKIPRDRNGTYEPQIIEKHKRCVDGMEEKILALYACGMSQRDSSEQIKNLYDVDISPELVSEISEKNMPEVSAWQNQATREDVESARGIWIHIKTIVETTDSF